MRRFINASPGRGTRFALGVAPFLVLLVIYVLASGARLAQNPHDKLLPTLTSMGKAMTRMAFEPNKRSGEYLLWRDTQASLRRLAAGVGLSALIGLIFGVASAALPLVRAGVSPLITTVSLVPPMAVLPILFIVFGLGEVSKVVLIMFGIAPFIVRDLQQRGLELPREQLVKAQTLGASSWQVVLRVVLPQLLPRLLDAVKLSLGAAWLFLIAAEGIAATEGLGYRIFLVRRYLAMDVIIPYVIWITFLAFVLHWALRELSRRCFPWFHAVPA